MKTHHTRLAHLAKVTLLCLSFLMLASQSVARDIAFSWTASSDPITGYKLYYKTGENSSPPYDGTGLDAGNSPILLPNITTTIVTGLSPTETYHFVITAYNETEESGYSAIESFYPIILPAPSIINMFQY